MAHLYQAEPLVILSTTKEESLFPTPTSAIVGRRAELIFEEWALRKGLIISRPQDPGSCSYDYITDYNGKLARIQVKALRKRKNGKLELKLRSTHRNSGDHVYTEEDADWIVGVDLDTGTLYWVDTNHIDGRSSVTF